MEKILSFDLSTQDLDAVEGDLGYPGPFTGRGRFDHFDVSRRNIFPSPVTCRVHDARPVSKELSIDREGFALVKHATQWAHLRDPEDLRKTYLYEMLPMIKAMSGADWVIPRDEGLLIRRAASSDPGNKAGAKVSTVLHKDYTKVSAETLVGMVSHMLPRPYRRMAIIQTWRSLSPGPQDFPLMLCDSQTVASAEIHEVDTVIGPPNVATNIFESGVALHSTNHRWYYFSNMQVDEVIVIKGYDSELKESMNSLHGSFDNRKRFPDAISRVSVEARYFAFWE